MKALLHTDGGSRGNPGPSGSGAVLFDADGVVIDEAIKFFKDLGEEYKVKIIQDIPQDDVLTIYHQHDFADHHAMPFTRGFGAEFDVAKPRRGIAVFIGHQLH